MSAPPAPRWLTADTVILFDEQGRYSGWSTTTTQPAPNGPLSSIRRGAWTFDAHGDLATKGWFTEDPDDTLDSTELLTFERCAD